MKKIKTSAVLFLVTLLLAGFCGIMGGATSSKAASVKKVVCTPTYKNGSKVTYVVTAQTTSGKTAWKYKTGTYEATELDAVSAKLSGNYVYVYEAGRLMKFAKNSGKRIWKTGYLTRYYGMMMGVDKQSNVYMQGYYGTTIYKVSSKGKLVWKTEVTDTNYYWPSKLKISGSTLKIQYEGNDETKYLFFNTKTGKIK